MISSRGTDIPNAIKTSVEAFGNEGEQQKMIFLFSDGENHSENSLANISFLVKNKIDLHVIGVGSTKGSLIPLSGKENSFVKSKKESLFISKKYVFNPILSPSGLPTESNSPWVLTSSRTLLEAVAK